MRRYQPTTEEIDALFKIADFLHDAITINNDNFYNEEIENEEKKIIFESTKIIYKSCLKIYKANQNLPFG